MPPEEGRCAEFLCDACGREGADVCGYGGLEYAGGEVGVRSVDVLCGEEAHEGVADGGEVGVGGGVRRVGCVGAVEGEEGGVGAGLEDEVRGGEDGGEADSVGKGGEGGGGRGLEGGPGFWGKGFGDIAVDEDGVFGGEAGEMGGGDGGELGCESFLNMAHRASAQARASSALASPHDGRSLPPLVLYKLVLVPRLPSWPRRSLYKTRPGRPSPMPQFLHSSRCPRDSPRTLKSSRS